MLHAFVIQIIFVSVFALVLGFYIEEAQYESDISSCNAKDLPVAFCKKSSGSIIFSLSLSQFSQLVLVYGRFQGNSFIIRDLQICEKLYDVRFMFFLIFPYKVFLFSLQ